DRVGVRVRVAVEIAVGVGVGDPLRAPTRTTICAVGPGVPPSSQWGEPQGASCKRAVSTVSPSGNSRTLVIEAQNCTVLPVPTKPKPEELLPFGVHAESEGRAMGWPL